LKFVVDCDIVLSRAPSGPIAAYIETFAKSLREQGYAPQSIHRQVFLSAGFSEWLARRQPVLRRITFDLALQYLKYRFRHVQPSRGDAAALEHLLAFLRGEGGIPAEKIAAYPATSAERCVRAYEEYLREACGLSQATIINYVPFVLGFLGECFGKGPVVRSQRAVLPFLLALGRRRSRFFPEPT